MENSADLSGAHHRNCHLESLTDLVSDLIEGLQYELGEGPCIDAHLVVESGVGPTVDSQKSPPVLR